MYGRLETAGLATISTSTPRRPMSVIQSRPNSAHRLATAGARIQLLNLATIHPRSGSDNPENEPLPVATPRQSLLDTVMCQSNISRVSIRTANLTYLLFSTCAHTRTNAVTDSKRKLKSRVTTHAHTHSLTHNQTQTQHAPETV